MTKTFTLKQLSETSRLEAETRAVLMQSDHEKEGVSDLKKSSLNNILAYSKSLGVTNTSSLGKQLMTLN